ncbi:MAG: PilZ domain-containing protein [Halioglobus sp.]|nr:PilZ domain-containing protein [Halioglobus sp.]
MANNMSAANQERRQHERIEFAQAIYIEIVSRRRRPESNNRILRCETVNVSVGGLQLFVPEPVPAGSKLHLAVPLQNGRNNLELTGLAVWVTPAKDNAGCWLGLQLDDSDKESMEKWFRVVHSLSSKPAA